MGEVTLTQSQAFKLWLIGTGAQLIKDVIIPLVF